MTLRQLLGERKPILIDGAMGTELARAGLPMGGQSNLSAPQAVEAVHRGYAESGCDILITNTLTMNPVYVENHLPDIDVREANLAGARLARKVAGDALAVLGDIGSTGKMIQPFGELATEAAEAAFRDQAAILVEGGVDGFIIETMFDLREALLAVTACKAVSELPVLVTMAFASLKHGGCTVMGDTAKACAEQLAAAGADAIGTNCGDLDPMQMAEVVAGLRGECALPIIAQPNAGKPKLIGDRTVFDMAPDAFAEGIVACADAGASLVGGCCGTTPAHIRAVARRIGRTAGS